MGTCECNRTPFIDRPNSVDPKFPKTELFFYELIYRY